MRFARFVFVKGDILRSVSRCARIKKKLGADRFREVEIDHAPCALKKDTFFCFFQCFFFFLSFIRPCVRHAQQHAPSLLRSGRINKKYTFCFSMSLSFFCSDRVRRRGRSLHLPDGTHRSLWTTLGLQSHCGDTPLKLLVICPQNGTAVLKEVYI